MLTALEALGVTYPARLIAVAIVTTREPQKPPRNSALSNLSACFAFCSVVAMRGMTRARKRARWDSESSSAAPIRLRTPWISMRCSARMFFRQAGPSLTWVTLRIYVVEWLTFGLDLRHGLHCKPCTKGVQAGSNVH